MDGFLARRDRLLRWGWTESAAKHLAERLMLRDHEADQRVSLYRMPALPRAAAASMRRQGWHRPTLAAT